MEKNKGFTLVETVVAIALIVIISVCVLSVSLSSQKSYMNSSAKFFLANELNNLSEICIYAYNNNLDIATFENETQQFYNIASLNSEEQNNKMIYAFYFDSDFKLCGDESQVYKMQVNLEISGSVWSFSGSAHNLISGADIYQYPVLSLGATL